MPEFEHWDSKNGENESCWVDQSTVDMLKLFTKDGFISPKEASEIIQSIEKDKLKIMSECEDDLRDLKEQLAMSVWLEYYQSDDTDMIVNILDKVKDQWFFNSKEQVQKLLEISPGAVGNYLRYYINEPWGKDIISEVIKKSPFSFLSKFQANSQYMSTEDFVQISEFGYKELKDQVIAENYKNTVFFIDNSLLKEIAKLDPEAANRIILFIKEYVDNFPDVFLDCGWELLEVIASINKEEAVNVLETAMNKSRWYLLRYTEKYLELWIQLGKEKVIKIIVEQSGLYPEELIECSHEFLWTINKFDQEGGKQIVKNLEKATKDDPDFAIKHIGKFLPQAKEVSYQSAQRMVENIEEYIKKNPWNSMLYANIYLGAIGDVDIKAANRISSYFREESKISPSHAFDNAKKFLVWLHELNPKDGEKIVKLLVLHLNENKDLTEYYSKEDTAVKIIDKILSGDPKLQRLLFPVLVSVLKIIDEKSYGNEVLLKLLKKYLWEICSVYPEWINEIFSLIEISVVENPNLLFDYNYRDVFNNMIEIDEWWTLEVIKKIAFSNFTYEPIWSFNTYLNFLWEKHEKWIVEMVKISAKNHPDILFQNISNNMLEKIYSINKEWVSEMFIQASKKSPSSFLYHIYRFYDAFEKKEPNIWKELIKEAVLVTPSSALELLIWNRKVGSFRRIYWWAKFIQKILREINDDRINKIIEISEMNIPRKLKGRLSTVLEKIASDWVKINDLLPIIEDDKMYFQLLIDIQWKEEKIWRQSVEISLSRLSLLKVHEINERHEWPLAPRRFESVKGSSSKELFSLMVYWEQEVFTSTFKGLFSSMIKQMKKEKISWDQLLNIIGYNKYRTFIKMCAWFNKLWEFLNTMSQWNQKKLLNRFVSNLENEENIEAQAVAAADTFWMLLDKKLLWSLAEIVKKEYERVAKEWNTEWKKLYGLLASILWSKDGVKDTWLLEMAKEYKLPSLVSVSTEKLYNPDGTNVQQYFFYDDRWWWNAGHPERWDGHQSFKNFLVRYGVKVKWDKEWVIQPFSETNHKWWKVEDKWSYVYLSTEAKDGKRMEIYANKPDHEEDGPDQVDEYLKEKNVKSIMIVHRWHSYHAQKTIDRIPAIAAIVSLWSCGWYNNMEAVLRKAPNAHILSTKWTGTMLVNDPLFKTINRWIREWKDIHWPTLWAEVERMVWKNENFKDYVPPHKNLWVMFLKAFRDNNQ